MEIKYGCRVSNRYAALVEPRLNKPVVQLPPEYDFSFAHDPQYQKFLEIKPEPENRSVVAVINDMCDKLTTLPILENQSQSNNTSDARDVENAANDHGLSGGENAVNRIISSVTSTSSGINESTKHNESNEHNTSKWSDICLAEEKALRSQNDEEDTSPNNNAAIEDGAIEGRRVFPTMYFYNRQYHHRYVSPIRRQPGGYHAKKGQIDENEQRRKRCFTGRTFCRSRSGNNNNNNRPETGSVEIENRHDENDGAGSKGAPMKRKTTGRRDIKKNVRKQRSPRHHST